MSVSSYKPAVKTDAVVAPARPGGIFAKAIVFPLGMFACALIINLGMVWANGFDGLYGQDAYSYFAHGGELRYHWTLLHHWQWEAGPRPLFWPFGYPATLALLFMITGATAGAAQMVSMLTWAGACALLTSLGQKLSGSWLGGIAAGGLMALSPLGRQLAVSVMSDTEAVLWTVLCVWLVIKARENARGWYLVGAGLGLGLATITRYAAATALPLMLIGAAWPWAGFAFRTKALSSEKALISKNATQTAFKLTKQNRSLLKWLILGLGVAALVYLPQFVINQTYPAAFWTDSWLTDWSPFNAIHSHFNTRDGFASYATPPLVFYLVYSLLNLHLLTALAGPLLGLGLFYLWQQKSAFALLVLLVWWLVPVLFLSGIPYESERFMLTFLPPLALLSGAGVVWLSTHWPLLAFEKWRKPIIVTGLVMGAVSLGLLSQIHLNGFMQTKAADLATVQQVAQTIPAQATLITFDLSLTFDHYTDLKIRDLSFLDAASIKMLTNEQQVYLLADSQKMAQQWVGHPVGDAYQAALSKADPTPIAHFGRYTLWKLD